VGLADYFKKRSFKKTPEPKGTIKRTPSHKLVFVVQEHHARALHWDFRLEMDGVLKSWAVPKGISTDPHEHHLAIQTEDHPYEYRKFHGTIPEGEYGAGEVKIWDRGWYEARKGDPKDSEKTLKSELKKGHLTFMLHGEKLKGEFALIKFHGPQDDDGKSWLLVKKGDEYAHGDSPVESDPPPKLGTTRSHPWKVKPMLTTLIDKPFSRAGWIFENKWDGYRAIGAKHGGDVQLYSRNHNDFRAKYPEVTEALHALKHDVILDGEIVVADKDGHPHFEWLQMWNENTQGELLYNVFDLLWLDGHDLRDLPLLERKKQLKNIIPKAGPIRFSDHIEQDGLKLFKEMQRLNLEGMVAKRADSPYREDVRGQDWLKIKTHLRQEVVIGGYTEPRGGRKYIGSLVVGVYEKDQLVYVGHSGGGIPDDERKRLQEKFAKIGRKTSPFKTEPKPNAPVHWVEPKLVCEMSFAEWTSSGTMRQPQFEGMREDKSPRDIKREKSRHMTPPDAAPNPTNSLPFEQTHPDKIFFPKLKITKGDMFKYYESVAEYILPYLKDRPHSLNRMPNGIAGESFYQKNNEHLPDWVPHADIFSDSNNANLHWIVGGNLETLLYMVQLGCIEINPWNSRVGSLEKPDWIVIDLDPEGVGFKGVVETAKVVHNVCDEWKIPCHPKTSGKTGIHIYIPMGARYTYEQGKNLAHLIVLEVNERLPKITSVERMPEKRKRKIYLDFLQNREGQTLAAPYSLRPTPEATVSMPLHWDEVKPSLKPTDFTIKNALGRIKRNGDLWKPILGHGVDLPKILKAAESSSRNP
jgi:bifunctional non-homologous end joining protein LigD